MDCAEAKLQIEPYVAGELPPDQKGPLEEHIAGCAECRLDTELTRASRNVPVVPAADAPLPPDPSSETEASSGGSPQAPTGNWTLDSIFGAGGKGPAPGGTPSGPSAPGEAASPHGERSSPPDSLAEASDAPEESDADMPATSEDEAFSSPEEDDPELPAVLDHPAQAAFSDEPPRSDAPTWDFEPADVPAGAKPPEGSLFFAQEALSRGTKKKRKKSAVPRIILWATGGLLGVGLLALSIWIAMTVRQPLPSPNLSSRQPIHAGSGPESPGSGGVTPPTTEENPGATSPSVAGSPSQAPPASAAPSATTSSPAPPSAEPPQSSDGSTQRATDAEGTKPIQKPPSLTTPPRLSATTKTSSPAVSSSSPATSAPKTSRATAKPRQASSTTRTATGSSASGSSGSEPSTSTREVPSRETTTRQSASHEAAPTRAAPEPPAPAPSPSETQPPSGATTAPPATASTSPAGSTPPAPGTTTEPGSAATAPPAPPPDRPIDKLHQATLNAEQNADLIALRKLRDAWRGFVKTSIGPDRARAKRELADCLWAVQMLTSKLSDQKEALAAYRDYVLNAPAGGADARTVARMRQLEDALSESR